MPCIVDEDDFWSRTVETVDGCYFWTGHAHPQGHAYERWQGQLLGVHRIALMFAGVDVPDGWQADHLCHTYDPTCRAGSRCLHRRCVNPGHLEPVPPGENGSRAHRPQVDDCVNGHPFTEENTRWVNRGEGRPPSRQCRPCGIAASARHRARGKVT